MPFIMALNLLAFGRIGFVGKLTKQLREYNKRVHWRNCDGVGRLMDKLKNVNID
jgi:hypothetical protein